MKRRIITAVVGIPLLLIVLLAHEILTAIFVFAVAMLAAYEFLRLTDHYTPETPQTMILFVVALIVLLVLPLLLENDLMLAVFVVLALIAIGNYIAKVVPLWFVEGPLYLGIPLATVIALRLMNSGIEWIVIVLAATWATDTMALFGGKAFGRTKLTAISPNKTREGTAIGIVSGLIAVLAFGAILGLLQDHTLTVVLAAILLPPLAVLGDLLESKIKRTYGKKDSGAILPGHGGVLDRIDSTLFTAPTMWLLIVFFV